MLVIATPNDAQDECDGEDPLETALNSGQWKDVSELTGSLSPSQSLTGSVLSARDRRRVREAVSGTDRQTSEQLTCKLWQ